MPLRKINGVQDKIIFLGDYIDRRQESHLVLDFLIDLKKKYGDQIIFLKGNHEDMFLESLYFGGQFPVKYNQWFVNGGGDTLIGYLRRLGINELIEKPQMFPRHRLKDIIPKEHLDFLETLLNFYETDSHIFVHAGCDPNVPLNIQDKSILLWDRSLYGFVRKVTEDNFSRSINGNFDLPWNKLIVTGHNTDTSGNPYLHHKFVMLDCSGSNVLMCVELNSKQVFKAQPKVSRLVRIA